MDEHKLHGIVLIEDSFFLNLDMINDLYIVGYSMQNGMNFSMKHFTVTYWPKFDLRQTFYGEDCFDDEFPQKAVSQNQDNG